MGPLARIAFLSIGLAAGMGGALLIEHASPRPILLAAAALLLVAAAVARVQRHMNRFERGHDARAEAFRLAMLAEHAPHLLPARHAAT